ncbi:MAG: hypothetical protein VB094_05660 [Oscillibacter sp.]|nr:hypothetical protein [Oscillibacter sp.]
MGTICCLLIPTISLEACIGYEMVSLAALLVRVPYWGLGYL